MGPISYYGLLHPQCKHPSYFIFSLFVLLDSSSCYILTRVFITIHFIVWVFLHECCDYPCFASSLATDKFLPFLRNRWSEQDWQKCRGSTKS